MSRQMPLYRRLFAVQTRAQQFLAPPIRHRLTMKVISIIVSMVHARLFYLVCILTTLRCVPAAVLLYPNDDSKLPPRDTCWTHKVTGTDVDVASNALVH